MPQPQFRVMLLAGLLTYIISNVYFRSVFTIEIARTLAERDFEDVKSLLKKQNQVKFSEHASSLLSTVDQLQTEHTNLNLRLVVLDVAICCRSSAKGTGHSVCDFLEYR